VLITCSVFGTQGRFKLKHYFRKFSITLVNTLNNIYNYLQLSLIGRHILKIVKNDFELLHVCLSVHLPTRNNLARTGWIFVKVDI